MTRPSIKPCSSNSPGREQAHCLVVWCADGRRACRELQAQPRRLLLQAGQLLAALLLLAPRARAGARLARQLPDLRAGCRRAGVSSRRVDAALQRPGGRARRAVGAVCAVAESAADIVCVDDLRRRDLSRSLCAPRHLRQHGCGLALACSLKRPDMKQLLGAAIPCHARRQAEAPPESWPERDLAHCSARLGGRPARLREQLQMLAVGSGAHP